MNFISRTLTGIVMVVVGLILITIPMFVGAGRFFLWIYGIPLLILGFFILFNKSEDKIEKIKTERRKNE